MTQIKLSRWAGEENTSRDNWKELISALVLAGYKVYADEKYVVFTLGPEDELSVEDGF